jgi:hypothetical protein
MVMGSAVLVVVVVSDMQQSPGCILKVGVFGGRGYRFVMHPCHLDTLSRPGRLLMT